MKDIDKSCRCKRRFDTEKECLDSIAKHSSLFELFAYKCRYGNHWHQSKHDPQGGTHEAKNHSRSIT